MIFSDKDIKTLIQKKDVVIEPFNDECLRSGSYTLTLGDTLFKLRKKEYLDPREQKQEYEEISLTNEGYLLQPNEFVLGSSKEHLELGDTVAALFSTRGSRAQIGLNVLLGSAYAEPGTNNRIALEIHNVSGMPIKLFQDLPMVKAIFMPLCNPADQKGRGFDFFRRQDLS